jgi:uncharacterized protein YfaS (alpha-2-macroglobulin family)
MHQILLYVAMLFCIAACSPKTNNLEKSLMSKIADNDYPKEWAEIDSFAQKALPKSALEKVIALHERAKKDKNDAQIIKTIIYRENFQNQTEEGSWDKSVSRLEKELLTADFPVKPLLQTMLAEMHQRFLTDNLWKMQSRTETADFKNDDLNTWTSAQLQQKAADYYLAAVKDARSKQTPVERFYAILGKGENTETLHPTLYDLLAHRAIDFFANQQSHLSEPAYKFYLDKVEYLSAAPNFIGLKIEAKDTSSFKFHALQLFQAVISTHSDNKNIAALTDADLKRLRFVRENAAFEDKENLYLNALEALKKRTAPDASAAEVTHQIAQLYLQKGNQYQPNLSNIGKWDIKKAIELCDEAIKTYPESYGAKHCALLKQQIMRTSISQVMTERVVVPNAPVLVNFHFLNAPTAFFKLLKLTESELGRLQTYSDEEYDAITNLTPLKAWTKNLPSDGDLREHSTEIKLDGLPLGIYALLVSENDAFSKVNNQTHIAIFVVSNLAFFTRSMSQGKNDFVLTDRTTGVPMKDVKAEFFKYSYDSNKRINIKEKFSTGLTDANGMVQTQKKGQSENFSVRFSKGDDVLFLEDSFYEYENGGYPGKYITTQFFLDRNLYRPGQMIYFKGLVLQHDEKGYPRIFPNQAVKVYFRDANSQKVAELAVKTNEYGTFSGNFTAPRGGLLGEMSLHTDGYGGQQQHVFRVEEYKRPKFDVTFNPVKTAYRINDLVKVTGTAKNFAGSNTDGAKVVYRVMREVRFPWMDWWGIYKHGGWNLYRDNASQEIYHDKTVTDANGNFEINFPALPDKTVNLKDKPEFFYKIYADVTDITGETHSTETSVTVGTIALKLESNIPEESNTEAFKSIEIITQNLNGEFEAAQGSVKIEALASNKQTIYTRYWDAPDMPILTETEFKAAFPQLSYKNEQKINQQKPTNTVFSALFDTKESKTIALPKNLPTGNYVITIQTKDKYGAEVATKQYTTIYDLKASTLPANQPFLHVMEQATVEPNNNAVFYIGASDLPAKVLFSLEKDGKLVKTEWLDVKNFTKIEIPIAESDRGGVFYTLGLVRNNRFFQVVQSINVPWTNKDLKIEYATFRDKLQPGAQEEWQIKISGKKADKIAAEMVAGMYDASLDKLYQTHNWNKSFYPTRQAICNVNANNFQQNAAMQFGYKEQTGMNAPNRVYPYFNWFGLMDDRNGIYAVMDAQVISRSKSSRAMQMPAEYKNGGAVPMGAVGANSSEVIVTGAVKAEPPSFDMTKKPLPPPMPNNSATTNVEKPDLTNVKPRKDLEETVFFFPHLMTDKDGSITLKFKMREALTRWKFLGFAHTKELEFAFTEKEIVTQKELMILPNAPRFLREGDKLEFAAKVSNISDKPLAGVAQLEFFDAMTMQPVKIASANTQNFNVASGQSAPLLWKTEIPSGLSALQWRIVAKAGDFSDGEENMLPVLTNQMLVTETLPLPVRAGQTKQFSLASMKNPSNTLRNHKVTLEFTDNPAWYAVQALPYIMEYPYECTEQIFSRFYANSLATHVANKHPRIKTVFDRWKNYQPDALLSNLSKNQELKYALLEETPWVMDAQNEAQQKQNIALLFDLNKMAYEQEAALKKITERQLGNGGFAWFPGGRDDWYITQYLVEGMGHLDKLGVKSLKKDEKTAIIIRKAVQYCDDRLVEYYENMKKYTKKEDLDNDHLDYMPVHYLYTRSFFQEIPIEGKIKEVAQYYENQAIKYWMNKDIYAQGLLALALNRHQKMEATLAILKSLKERALMSEELGMYWKTNRGWFWYEMPIETHALMIEVFDEITNDQKTVDELRVWLLKNKQTNAWKTTKATSSAIYALLLRGADWLSNTKPAEITLGSMKVVEAANSKEAGTGYFKTSWVGKDIKNDFANVTVKNPNSTIAWGAMYWQYFENLDKIKTFEATPLTIKKQLFKTENSDKGVIMRPISEGNTLKVGDKVQVRIEIRVDRDMEYVHLKDMRASGFEPENVLSQYKWQGGLGYYESTRDAATNFFISYLPKGTYVFEYPLRATLRGDFSNGITTMQCMYAPEFTSHSQGIRVKIE